LEDSFGLAPVARPAYFANVTVRPPVSSVVQRSAAAGLFLLRLMVTVAVTSRHPAPHFIEFGAALLLLLGLSTRAAASVVAVIELWLLTMRSGALTSALLATIALAVALIGPGSWSLDTQWLGWRRIQIGRTPNGNAQSS